MPTYNFKSMKPVPSAPELIDIVLMRTQRRTPTVIHPGYKITRIRGFYIRKVKFTQQTISERLTQILTDFPRLNDIHPFYADLCNTLYDRDHYKLALGQINTAKTLVESISRDMIRMIKYGDSLYRCKCLKKAALGRMCTVLKRQKASLSYLDEVRKHMSRLPSLDPTTRTLLICGLPNVGKSSWMNKVTRANVDVQPYAFTTKSLFVGHCDYKYLRWQVIDTPGILDHPLEDRNTIEMQSIVALAHLQCSVLFFVDISEQCGYTIEQQCNLFRSIQPLFANKQLILVVNKIDQQPWDTLDADKRHLVLSLVETTKCTLLTMSNLSEEGVSDVKSVACEKLLAQRVDARVSGKKLDHVMNRLRVFEPQPRDGIQRPAFIPESVLRAREAAAAAAAVGRFNENTPPVRRARTGYAPTIHDAVDEDEDGDIEMDKPEVKKTVREIMWLNGGPGVFSMDYRDIYDLKNDAWRWDAIPEIIDGKNIADFVDPDILSKLDALEKEEEQIVAELEASKMEEIPESDLDSEEEAAVEAIRERKKKIKVMKSANQTQNRPMMPLAVRGKSKDKHDVGVLSAKNIKQKMDGLGVDTSKMIERGRLVDNRERGRKRERSLSRQLTKGERGGGDDADMEGMHRMEMDDSVSEQSVLKSQKIMESTHALIGRARSHSRPREPSQMGLKDEASVKAAKKLDREARKTWMGASGEGDNRKSVHLVKWMHTGKRRGQKTSTIGR